MTTDNREQKRAVIDAAIQPATHRSITIRIPIDKADELKRRAKQEGRIFRGYACEKLLLGMEIEKPCATVKEALRERHYQELIERYKVGNYTQKH